MFADVIKKIAKVWKLFDDSALNIYIFVKYKGRTTSILVITFVAPSDVTSLWGVKWVFYGKIAEIAKICDFWAHKNWLCAWVSRPFYELYWYFLFVLDRLATFKVVTAKIQVKKWLFSQTYCYCVSIFFRHYVYNFQSFPIWMIK